MLTSHNRMLTKLCLLAFMGAFFSASAAATCELPGSEGAPTSVHSGQGGHPD